MEVDDDNTNRPCEKRAGAHQSHTWVSSAPVKRFVESGLTKRYPVDLLGILSTGHARYREVDAKGVLGCATCLKVIRAVASRLKILTNMPCYRPWDQKIARLLQGLEEVHLDPGTSEGVGRVVQGQVTWPHLKTFAPVMIDSDKIRTFVDHIVTPALVEIMLPDLGHEKLGPDDVDRSWQRVLDSSGPRLKMVEVWHRTDRDEDPYDAPAAFRKYTREIFLRRQLNVELVFVRDIRDSRRLVILTPNFGTTPLRSLSLLVTIANPRAATEFTHEVTEEIEGAAFPALQELKIIFKVSMSEDNTSELPIVSGFVLQSFSLLSWDQQARSAHEEAVSMSSLRDYIQGPKLWDALRRYCKMRRISLVIHGEVSE